MSESPLSPAQKPARPINRWGIGVLSILQIVLLAALLISANYLACRQRWRADLSRDRDYTLSPATTHYIASDVMQKREPILVTFAFRKNSPYYDRTRALVEEYARQSKGKIKLKLIDPIRSPDAALHTADQYGIRFGNNLDMVIIDARSAAETAAVTADAASRERSPHVRIVTTDDIVIYQKDTQNQRRPVGFQGEDAITAGLVAAIEGKPRKIYFLADKSHIDNEGERSPWQTLTSVLALQNVQLVPVAMSQLSAIPDDAAGVALTSPRYDFTPQEMAVLENYWQRPKSAVLALLGPEETPSKLRAFFRGNGVTPQRDRIMLRRGGQAVTTVQALFTDGIDFTKDLAGQNTLFEGASTSLEVREAQEDLVTRKIFPMPLIQAAPGYWGETKFGTGQEAYDAREDHAAPVYLAAAVTRGAANDDRFAATTSRMMVMSNTAFLDPALQREENLDFLAASVNWLIGREELAGVGPRELGTYKLPLLDAQVGFINRANLFFLPAFLLVIGGFVWSSRRA